MILIAIAIYIIVVGPVIYLILKKKDKREKGWVVIPATSVIFMLIVFVLSFNSHYKSGMLNIVSSTKLEQGQSIGKTDIYVSAKTSKKGNVHISADEFINVSIPSEDRWNYSETAKDICMNKIRVGEKTEVTYLDTKSWQNSDFELETTTDLSGILDCNFKMKDDKIVGSIANHTNRNFREIVVLAGQKIFMIDNLKIGQTYQVEEDITDKEYLSDVSNAKSSRILLQLFRDMYSRDTLNDRIKKGEITRQDAYRIMRESDMINNFMDMGASTYVKNTGDIHVFLYAFDEENILPQTFYINGETALENTLNLYRIEHSIRLAETENYAIAAFRELADYAAPKNVQIALETVTIMQTNFINTLAEGADMVERVNRPNFRLMMDVFHLNLEEPNVIEAIRAYSPLNIHVHLADNNRRYPGHCGLDFEKILGTFKECGYDGAFCTEIFQIPDMESAAKGAIGHLRPILDRVYGV